jgi:carbon-monoxide dehydrogenase small subunit
MELELQKEITVSVRINGTQFTATAAPEESLLEFLRTRAMVTDVKCGCNKGDCGTCTLILDGQPVKSCLVLVAQANNKEVWTVKGMAADPLMQALQESFATHGAIQCGFCTPGMLVTARSLLADCPQPDRAAIKEALSGNLCRCTGYKKIVDAVAAVAVGQASARVQGGRCRVWKQQ